MGRSIQWFVDNPIAANLLMIIIVLGGVLTIGSNSLDKELFPAISTNTVTVSVPYPGAGPSEVEEQICLRVEEAVQDLDGIEKITSTASEGMGVVAIEVAQGFATQQVFNDIKTRVDAIHTFPVEAERPQINEESFVRNRVVRVSVAGDVDERTLKDYTEAIRDDLSALPHVDLVRMNAVRSDEVSIEVSEYDLRRYGLSFEKVQQAVRDHSLNLPAGTIRSERGDIRLQTRGQAYTAAEFERIPLISRADGTRVLLGDVATVVDGFEDRKVYTRFNGLPAMFLDVYISVDPDVLVTSREVSGYLRRIQPTLPPGIEVTPWLDSSDGFRARMDMMANNALGGLALVFLVLMLFLRPMLALWVAVGIFVAYMGTLWLLPYLNISLNMISLSSFLLILGIVVDDAIIIGESVYSQQHKGLPGAQGAAAGTRLVAKPVMFAVVSTMLVFIPMFFMPGDWSTVLASVPVVALLALSFSLLESFWILPSHLSHLKPERPARHPVTKTLESVRLRFVNGMTGFAGRRFRPFLERSLQWNGLAIGGFILAFILSLCLVAFGYINRSFMPVVAADFVMTNVVMPEGNAFDDTLAVTKRIEAGVDRLKDDPLLDDGKPGSIINNTMVWVEENTIWVMLDMDADRTHDIGATAIGERWKEYIGPIPHADSYDVMTSLHPEGKDISLLVTATDLEQLRAASDEIEALLDRYPGVHNVRDSMSTARDDIDIVLRPHAESLGIGLANVARQVRQGFYGAEAQRIPRLREDVKVMIRYRDEERRTVDALSDMRVRTADGREVPFEAVAETEFVPGYTKIKRIDRQRAVEITADTTPAKATATAVIGDFLRDHRAELERRYPGLQIAEDGATREEQEVAVSAFLFLILSMIGIYTLMAVEFRSYLKPLGVLSAVPFGMMGAIFGHLIMGQPFTLLSFFGILAVAGVVVNDNLVLIDRINRYRREGAALKQALLDASQDRFRPIILTSLTTFIGLVPMMMETSMQARFLMPMIVSLAFGVLFATLVTLIFVPSLYLAGARLRARFSGASGAGAAVVGNEI